MLLHHHSAREVRIRPFFISQSPSLFSRFKKILKIHIPDPEKFFPPLITVHGGDIQVQEGSRWLLGKNEGEDRPVACALGRHRVRGPTRAHTAHVSVAPDAGFSEFYFLT